MTQAVSIEQELWTQRNEVIQGLLRSRMIVIQWENGSYEHEGERVTYVNWKVLGEGITPNSGCSDNRREAIHDIYIALEYMGYIVESEVSE